MAKTATPPAKSTKSSSSANTGGVIRPLHDKILVRRDEAETKTESGIFLPEKSKDRPKTGTVEAVGTGTINSETGELIPLTVKKGDRIIFTSYSGTEVKLGDTELLIMTEDEVLAVID
jgi:chaperonin GroES